MKYTLDDLRDDLSREFGGGHASATKKQHYKGSKGGDGGAAARKQQEDARIASAVEKLNQVFGLSQATPETVDRNQFMRTEQFSSPNSRFMSIADMAQPQTRTVFDEVGYNRAVSESQAKANALKDASAKREKLYATMAEDAKATAMNDLDRERTIAGRDLSFMLARQGLSGGSRDIDANKDIADTYGKGVLRASTIGSQVANNARSADEKTRQGLISSIHAGLTQDDAIRNATESMKNNAALAQDEASTSSLLGFFDALRQQQQQQQYQTGVQSVVNGQQNVQSPYRTTMKNSFSGRVSNIA